METSIFIGQILWPLMISIWIWLFFNTEMFQKIIHDILREPLALFISGLMWFVLWSMMLKYHNSWEISRNLLITILWWAIFIKSFLVIAFPKIIFSMIKNIRHRDHRAHRDFRGNSTPSYYGHRILFANDFREFLMAVIPGFIRNPGFLPTNIFSVFSVASVA